MVCPYNRKVCKTVNQSKEDADGISHEVWIEEYTQQDCPKEGCGAWTDGECKYNQ